MPDTASPRVHPTASYVTPHGMAFGQPGDEACFVHADQPLPVTTRLTAAQPEPLAGTTGTSAVSGPFAPELGRAIWVTLSGDWTGSAQLLRSIDGGITRLPLTVGGQPWGSFTANANEAVTEESVAGATYYLAMTLATGTLDYRVAQ